MEHTECIAEVRPDTPGIDTWREYNERKAELFREYGHGVEYDRAVLELINELGI